MGLVTPKNKPLKNVFQKHMILVYLLFLKELPLCPYFN